MSNLETLGTPTAVDLPQHILVVGVDASGKSTTLETLESTYGYVKSESTSTPEAKAFKERSLGLPISAEYVSERRAMFLRLCAEVAVQHAALISSGERIAVADSTLVTRLSHAVMEQTTSIVDNPAHHLDVVREWIDTDPIQPDRIVRTYAPFEVIRGRIVERQDQGDKLEGFWGFNAPIFLDRYQDAWGDAIELIDQETDITCLSFDTNVIEPYQITEQSVSEV